LSREKFETSEKVSFSPLPLFEIPLAPLLKSLLFPPFFNGGAIQERV
jgi:hypothetical protein